MTIDAYRCYSCPIEASPSTVPVFAEQHGQGGQHGQGAQGVRCPLRMKSLCLRERAPATPSAHRARSDFGHQARSVARFSSITSPVVRFAGSAGGIKGNAQIRAKRKELASLPRQRGEANAELPPQTREVRMAIYAACRTPPSVSTSRKYIVNSCSNLRMLNRSALARQA